MPTPGPRPERPPEARGDAAHHVLVVELEVLLQQALHLGSGPRCGLGVGALSAVAVAALLSLLVVVGACAGRLDRQGGR